MANLTATPANLTEAIAALKGKDRVKIGHNTELVVEVTPKGRSVAATLHGNKIVRYTLDGTYASWAGWVTTTTADRLRQLAHIPANIRKGEAYLDGEEAPAFGWVKL